MNNSLRYLGLLAAGIPAAAVANDNNRPNIVVILADDMGYSDIGCYGGEIETPNLNALAEHGLRWSQFYNNARSCPSRAALMTGLYPHQAGMGWMAAANLGTPQYQGVINDNCVTIAEVLGNAGYSTYMTGKWHLCRDRQVSAKVTETWPQSRGFEEFYGIAGGAANYFIPELVSGDKREKPGKGHYFTAAISDKAASFIEEHDYDEKPLFLYLAYTAPHWPLHALEKDIAKYKGRYDCGWDELRQERFDRQKGLGLFSEETVLTPRDSSVPAWDMLTKDEQEEFAQRMEIYAAQIDAMDQGIGRVVKALKDAGQFDNTIIMFMSDNGACAEYISRGKRTELDGKSDTYESYRINWANASSTPYKEYKHFAHEGGIASPLIVSWPDGIDASFNGSMVREYGYFTDIMATCVDVSGAEYPEVFKGNPIIPMEGVSLAPNFKGEDTGRGMTFWEHEANIAVRDGKWKIVLKTQEGKKADFSKIELYDMDADPTEMNNLASKYPERVRTMFSAWNEWADRVGLFPLDTRNYVVKANASRRFINGDFQDNFGDWAVKSTAPADVRFSIDRKETISGEKSAKIQIYERGTMPNQAFMKWRFPASKDERLSLGFKYKSNRANTLILRVEHVKNAGNKILSETIMLKKGEGTYHIDDIRITEPGHWNLVFYFGTSDPGDLLLDDVELSFYR